MIKSSREQPEKTFAVLATLSVTLLVLSSAVCLNRGLIFFPGWRTTPLAGLKADTGFADRAPTYHAELSSHDGASLAEVWEDGRPLPGPANALHDDIRNIGRGRYSFWHGAAYFAASDNSDPRTNGRRYEIHYPWSVNWIVAFVLYASTVLCCARAFWFAVGNQHLPAVQFVISKAEKTACSFHFSALLLTAVVLFTHLPFFLYYPVVGIASDSPSYVRLVDAIRQGVWPHFTIRTPGYPLLIWLVTGFADRWLIVILVQCLIALGAALLLIYAVNRSRKALTLPAALALCGFLGGGQALVYDTGAISESLYASVLIVSMAGLIFALVRKSPFAFASASAAMAASILVRPSGAFLLVIYLLTLAFIAWNRYPARALLSFLTPLPAVLLALCAYNRVTLGNFTLSPYGEENLVGATILYWEADPSLPDFVNEALKDLPESYRRENIPKRDLKIVHDSWDPALLYNIYLNSYNPLVHNEQWGYGTRFHHGDYLATRAYIRRCCLVAIRRHPNLYAKFVLVNMLMFFEAIDLKFDFDAVLVLRAKQNYASGHNREYDINYAKEYRSATPPVGMAVAGSGAAANVTLSLPVLHRIQLALQAWHQRVFEQIVWIWAYFLVLVLSLMKLVRSRGRHLGAFILTVLTLMALGSAAVVCLVETACDRYSYPTQFIYYLSVALLPLLWTMLKTPDGTRTSE